MSTSPESLTRFRKALEPKYVEWLRAELAELEKLTDDRLVAERVLLRDYPEAGELLGIGEVA